MIESEYTFAFFPYLKTSEPIYYRGLTIKSSDDSSGLPSDAIQHLETLRVMFFLRDHLRIQKMSYAFHASSSSRELRVSDFKQRLLEFQTLVRFIYSTPDPKTGEPFLRYEHANLYVFHPEKVPKYLLVSDHNVEVLPEAQTIEFDARSEVEGYKGHLNNESYFWVTRGSRIFPSTATLWLNIFQDLSITFNHRLSRSSLYKPVVEYFTTTKKSADLEERILTALTWYNRSIAMDIDESVALLNLAIAFESLLDLDAGEKVTARFKEAVSLLVGDVPRLESWLIQFYQARSKIVHEGRSSNLMFMATDDPRKPSRSPELEYRSLVSYGRQVFQVCVATIVTGAQIARQLKLSSLLVTNQQRLERICQVLRQKDVPAADRIVAASQDVLDVETYQLVAEKGLRIEQLVGTTKLMIQQYLDTVPDEPPKLMKLLKEFAGVDSNDYYAALSLLMEIHDNFKSRDNEGPAFQRIAPRSVVISLINSVWYYTFMSYFQLDRQQKQKEAEDAT